MEEEAFDMFQLTQFVASVRHDTRIPTYGNHQLKQSIVLKVLHLLGWDAFNPSEVTPDYHAGGMTIDYALQTPGGPIFLHIVKPLTDKTLEAQEKIAKTATASGANIAVLTDGLHWRFLATNNHAPLYDKEFLRVDLTSGDPDEVTGLLKRILHHRIAISGTAFARAEKIFAERVKRKHQLFRTALLEAWTKELLEARAVFSELLAVEVKRLTGRTVTTDVTDAAYDAFTALATAETRDAKRLRYDASLDSDALRAWSTLLTELRDFFTELLTWDIEAAHNFHPDREALESFLVATQQVHDAALERHSRKIIVE